MTTDLLLLISLFEGAVGISTETCMLIPLCIILNLMIFVQSISECCAYFDDLYIYPFLDNRSVSQNLMSTCSHCIIICPIKLFYIN